ncbi:MAG TPA: hypothetical protein VNJ08_01315 [Bacteriovoracaceae bacterium]|nr:hypothetical protein [Bacteriovoracaceae bacterium]
MKGISKLDGTSRTLVFLSFVGIIASLLGSYYLANRSTLSLEDRDPIASITFSKNDTRVKRSSDVHWNNITGAVDCYKNDRVFTGPESEANIKFPGGMEIKLHPNSLVILSNNLIELYSGTIDINMGKEKGPDVRSFGEKFTPKKDTQFRLVQNNTQQKIIPLNAAAKEMVVQPALKEIITATPSETKFAPLGIKLKSKTLDFNNTESFKAQVIDQNLSDEYQIVVKNDAGVIVKDETSENPSYDIKFLPDGQYQMTVIGKIKGKAIGEALMPFAVSSKALPALEIPGKYMSFSSKDVAVPLKWNGTDSTEYELELAEGTKETVVSTNKVDSPEFNFKITKPGKYFWRVRYKAGELISPYSEYSEIEIKDSVTLIKGPLMISPEHDRNYEFKAGKVNFKWREPDSKFSYTFELYDDPDATPIKSLKVSKGKLDQNFNNKNATYWWRVFATSPYGQTTPTQTKYRFTVTTEKVPVPVLAQEKIAGKTAPIPWAPAPKPEGSKNDGIDYIELKGRQQAQHSEW